MTLVEKAERGMFCELSFDAPEDRAWFEVGLTALLEQKGVPVVGVGPIPMPHRPDPDGKYSLHIC